MLRPQYVYKARVVKVVDGDTVDLVVDCGFHIQHEIRTRLLDINAPETSTAAGKAARDYLRGLLPVGAEVQVKTFATPGDKYGRWLCELQLDKVLVNKQMIDAGHAVPYSGG